MLPNLRKHFSKTYFNFSFKVLPSTLILSFGLGLFTAAYGSPEAPGNPEPIDNGNSAEIQQPAAPPIAATSCTEKFLAKQENRDREAVCARTIDDALSTEVRVGQATSRIVGLSFSSITVENERRCDCEFAYGRYDITPRQGFTDKVGWKRWACKKFVTKDGPYCGQRWFKSDEGFRPFVCDNTQPGQEKCIEGTFVSWLKNKETGNKELVPVTACARKDIAPSADGSPAKDVLVLVVDADVIPTYKKHINGCIAIEIKKDMNTKQITFFGTAFDHPLPDVQTQPLLRGEIKKKSN